MGGRWASWPFYAGALLALALYLPRLNAPFLWDDVGTIAMNRALDRPIPARNFIGQAYYGFSGEQSWRPLATLSYYAMIRVFGKSPLALRSVHFAAHILIGFLWMAFLASCGFSAAAAAWAAGLFLLQPAHVETLMCVSFNEEILVALGLLFFIYFHRRRKTLPAALGLSWAFLSKETAIVGLPLVVLLDYLSGEKIKKRLGSYAVYASIAALYLALYFGPLKGPGPADRPVALPGAMRIFYALDGLATAARVFALPVRLRIEYFALPPGSWISAAAILAAFAFLAAAWVGAALYFLRRGRKLALFFLLWPLGFLALTSNIIPTTVLNTRLLAERWLYLPFLGLAALLGLVLQSRPRLGVLVMIFWSSCAWARLADWESSERLWKSLIQIYPWCAKAWEGLGEAHFNDKRYARARDDFARALELRESRKDRVLAYYAARDPSGFLRWDSPSLWRWLGRSDIALGQIQRADGEFQKAVAISPRSGYSYDIMAYSWAARGRWAKADSWLQRGLKARPRESFLLRLEPDLKKKRLSFKARFF